AHNPTRGICPEPTDGRLVRRGRRRIGGQRPFGAFPGLLVLVERLGHPLFLQGIEELRELFAQRSRRHPLLLFPPLPPCPLLLLPRPLPRVHGAHPPLLCLFLPPPGPPPAFCVGGRALPRALPLVGEAPDGGHDVAREDHEDEPRGPPLEHEKPPL